MEDRIYYVFCADGCKFESMTKEQIFAAIAEATGNTPTEVDSAFITKIKELNADKQLSFWVGTTAQYNAIAKAGDVANNCFYIVTDDTFGDDINTIVAELMEEVNAFNAKVAVFANDTGWLKWTNNGRDIGYYRLLGKTAYLLGEAAYYKDPLTFGITLPVILDIPGFFVKRVNTCTEEGWQVNSDGKTINRSGDENESGYIDFEIVFPYKGENPDYVA